VGEAYLETIGDHQLSNQFPELHKELLANISSEGDELTPKELAFLQKFSSEHPDYEKAFKEYIHNVDIVSEKSSPVGGILGSVAGAYGGYKYNKNKELKDNQK